MKLWVFISHVSDWAKQKPKKITHPHFSGHLHLTGGSGLIELRVSQYKTGVKESQGKSWPMSLMCVQYWAVVRNMIHGYVFRPKKVIKNNYGLRLFDLMEKIHANPILLYVLWSSELNALWNEINGVTHSRATSICWDCGACGFRGLLFPLRRLWVNSIHVKNLRIATGHIRPSGYDTFRVSLQLTVVGGKVKAFPLEEEEEN